MQPKMNRGTVRRHRDNQRYFENSSQKERFKSKQREKVESKKKTPRCTQKAIMSGVEQ